MTRSKTDIFSKAIERAADSEAARALHFPSGSSEASSEMHEALNQRLEQLRTAMGDASPHSTVEAPGLVPAHTPVAFAQAAHGEVNSTGRSKSAHWMVMSGTSLLLAGAAWYVLSQTPAASAPPVNSPDMAARPEVAVVAAGAPPNTTEVTPRADAPAPMAETHPVQAAPQPVSPVATAPVVAPSITPIVPSPTTPEAELREVIEAWRQAWSSRDTEIYLSFYGKAFQPEKGMALDQWKASRYRNVGGKTDIQVEVNDLRLTMVNEQLARATFLQDYRSGSYKETARRKSLLLARESDAWRVVKEWQGL